jgi:hypothetical protein
MGWQRNGTLYPVVEMPKLREFCLVIATVWDTPRFMQGWVEHIQAPRLFQFTIHVASWSSRHNSPSYVRDQIGFVLARFTTLRNLKFYCSCDSVILHSAKYAKGLVELNALSQWRERGISVKIFVVGRGYMEWELEEGRRAFGYEQ